MTSANSSANGAANHNTAHGTATSHIQHLVMSADLNHHRTLYAGRTAEWFVETGFVAAANLIPPEQIVCMKIHGMEFLHPVRAGEIASFEGKIVYAGRSSVIAFVRMRVEDRQIVEGFITFINVDQEGHPLPHGIIIQPKTPEEQELYERAKRLRSQSQQKRPEPGSTPAA